MHDQMCSGIKCKLHKGHAKLSFHANIYIKSTSTDHIPSFGLKLSK